MVSHSSQLRSHKHITSSNVNAHTMTRSCCSVSQHFLTLLLLLGALVVRGASAQTEGARWTTFVTRGVFQKMFPHRNAFYKYEAFRAAASARYPKFGNAGARLDVRRRELAAFLAHVKQESGGLRFVWEQDSEGAVYCKDDTAEVRAKYPCAPGKSYIGRGPLQLSWNYNYGDCGEALNLPLLTNPGLVANSPVTAFKSALWIWMSKGCHDAILQSNSFNSTIRIITGGLECGAKAKPEDHQRMLNRVRYYKGFCRDLNVDPGTDLECD